jgi:hypothetical protein
MKADSFAGRTPLPSISYRDRSARVGAAPPRAGGRPIVLARPRPGPRAAPARRASPATPLPLRPPPAGPHPPAGSCDAALNFRETADFTQPRFSSPVVSLVLLVVLHARINLAHTARASLRKLRRHPRRNPRVSMAHHLDDCIRRAPSFLRRRRVNIIFSARPSSSVSNPPPPATPTSGGRPQPN